MTKTEPTGKVAACPEDNARPVSSLLRALEAALRALFLRSGRATQGDFFKALTYSALFGLLLSAISFQPPLWALLAATAVACLSIMGLMFFDLWYRGRVR